MSATNPTASAHRTPEAAGGTEVSQLKPRLAAFVATAGGLGYLPKAPGTWGSLGAVALAISLCWLSFTVDVWRFRGNLDAPIGFWKYGMLPALSFSAFAVAVALLGLWAAQRVSRYTSAKDPQFVVIDEVSGQLFTYFLIPNTVLNWKSWLLGFILFRAFDIWKPFPARQAESLPGGWGIMADDWVAAIYAALGLWIARMLGL